MKIGIISLGCDKNTVDSERYVAQLAACGGVHTPDLTQADVILVNTCGFIDAAKKESIDALLEAARFKDSGVCRAVVAVGCMVERHRKELEHELPEVDVFLGASDSHRLIPELEERGLLGGEMALHPGERIYVGDAPHVRYLKISEGCDHGCAFCAIPLMRGRHRSFPLREVVSEAQLLELQGAREVNLVAQDLAHYGRDLRDGTRLTDVLQALLRETSIPWMRMLYIYSAGISDRLLELVATEPRIVPYFDIPIQHGADSVLARMRRPERRRTILATLARIRSAVPGAAVRTTCIAGFPGETEDEFRQLTGLLEEARFDRAAAFTYSEQQGTRAALMADDVPETVKRERLETVVETQRAITVELYEARLHSPAHAMVDRVHADGSVEGRLRWQADDIDGITFLADAGDARPGTLLEVIPTQVTDDYDFQARVVRTLSIPQALRTEGTSRALPLAPAAAAAPASAVGSSRMGSYGR